MYTRKGEEIAGEDGMEGPPVPIPNTEVKLHHADDTWRATAWKIRYLPAHKKRNRYKCICFFFYDFNLIKLSVLLGVMILPYA